MKKLLFNILAITLCLAVHSQDSLSYYLDIAVRNNPVVMQKFAEYQASLQKVPQVGSLPDPEMSLGFFLTPMELMGGNQLADVRLMQMFPWFGVLKYAKDEMSMMAKARYESFLDAQLQVCYEVQQSWSDLLKNRQEIFISEKSTEILQTVERLSLVKYRSGTAQFNTSVSSGNMSRGSSETQSNGNQGMQGMGSSQPGIGAVTAVKPGNGMRGSSMDSQNGNSGLVNVYLIQMEINDLANNIAFLKDQQNTLTARFNTSLNRNIATPVSLPDSLTADTSSMDIVALTDSLLINNPMLRMLRYESQSLEARSKMVSRMGYPMAGLGVSYSIIGKSEMSTSTMNGRDMIMPMVSITLPVYRKKYKAMQTEIRYLNDATAQGLQAAANQTRIAALEAFQKYRDASRKIALYSNQIILAENSFDILVKSYSASESDLIELLSIRRQILDYEMNQIEAVTDLNKAVAMLKRISNESNWKK